MINIIGQRAADEGPQEHPDRRVQGPGRLPHGSCHEGCNEGLRRGRSEDRRPDRSDRATRSPARSRLERMRQDLQARPRGELGSGRQGHPGRDRPVHRQEEQGGLEGSGERGHLCEGSQELQQGVRLPGVQHPGCDPESPPLREHEAVDQHPARHQRAARCRPPGRPREEGSAVARGEWHERAPELRCLSSRQQHVAFSMLQMSLDRLRETATMRGLSSSGSKVAIACRISSHIMQY